VKHPDMKVLYTEAQALLKQFDDAKIEHNLRHKNELADKLANLAMDRRADVTDIDGGSLNPAASPISALPSEGELAIMGEQFDCPRCGCEIETKHPATRPSTSIKPFTCQCGAEMRRKRLR
jgi:hypothetical protein